MATPLSQFNFIQFKLVMSVADIDETLYAFLLRNVFAMLNTQYSIDVDALTEIEDDLVFAIYRHVRFLYEVEKNNLDTIDKVSDPSGNKTTFKAMLPIEVRAAYKMYSTNLPAFL